MRCLYLHSGPLVSRFVYMAKKPETTESDESPKAAGKTQEALKAEFQKAFDANDISDASRSYVRLLDHPDTLESEKKELSRKIAPKLRDAIDQKITQGEVTQAENLMGVLRRTEQATPQELTEFTNKIQNRSLATQFHESIKALNLESSEQHLKRVRESGAFSKEEIEKLESELAVAQKIIPVRQEILDQTRLMGRYFQKSLPSILVKAERLKKDVENDGTFKNLDGEQKNLFQSHLDALVKIGTSGDTMRELFAKSHALTTDFYENRQTIGQIMPQWKNLRAGYQKLQEDFSSLPAEYATLPFVGYSFLDQRSKGKIQELDQIMALNNFLEAYGSLDEKAIPDTRTALENKINEDLGNPRKKIRLTVGSHFIFGGKRCKIQKIRGQQMLVNGEWMGPDRLYLIFLLLSGYGIQHTDPKDAKIQCEYQPAIKTFEDLERAIGLDVDNKDPTKRQTLRPKPGGEDGYIHLKSQKGGATVDIVKVDGSRIHIEEKGVNEKLEKEIRTSSISFQDFFEYWNEKRLIYSGTKGGVEAIFGKSPLTGDPGVRPPSRMISLEAIFKGGKQVLSAMKTQSERNSSIKAAEFATYGARFVSGMTFGAFKDLPDIADAAYSSEILGAINKLADSYKDLSAGELKDRWKNFNRFKLIEQAALCIAMAKKGLSKEELAVKLSRNKLGRERISHADFSKAVVGYFCEGPGKLPKKYESVLTETVSAGLEGEIEGGFKETNAFATSADMLNVIRGYAQDPFKRGKILGGIQALLKVGCTTEELGIAFLYLFKYVQNTADPSVLNGFTEVMLRTFGGNLLNMAPFGGLYLKPYGITLIRAMLDVYMTRATGGKDAFTVNSKAERVMGMIMMGRFGEVEGDLKATLKEKDFIAFRYLYHKAYGLVYSLQDELKGKFLTQYGSGKELDNYGFADTYGVGSCIYPAWLEWALDTDSTGKPKHLDYTAPWLKNLKGNFSKLKDSDDAKRLFAANFAEAYNQEIRGNKNAALWYWNNHDAAPGFREIAKFLGEDNVPYTDNEEIIKEFKFSAEKIESIRSSVSPAFHQHIQEGPGDPEKRYGHSWSNFDINIRGSIKTLINEADAYAADFKKQSPNGVIESTKAGINNLLPPI